VNVAIGDAASDVSISSQPFAFKGDATVLAVSPSVAMLNGGTMLSLVSAGVADGAQAWCRFAGLTVVEAEAVSGGAVQCTAVASIAGNVSVEVSTNNQDFTASGLAFEIKNINATSLSHVNVPVIGGSTLTVAGVGLAGLQQAYCGFGASARSETWDTTKGTVLASGSVNCMVPARGAGMRVVEIAFSKNGEMTRSGLQVEYAAIGSVTAVSPSTGALAGGTIVTVTGSGFVAGVTACKFGSAPAASATVVSSTEARCVTPAGARGSVVLRVAMGVEPEIAYISASMRTYTFVSDSELLQLSPVVSAMQGGSILRMVMSGVSDDSLAWCKFDGRTVVAASRSTDGGAMECVSVAGVAGNSSVEVSTNNQEYSSAGFIIEHIDMANVTSAIPSRHAVTGGSTVVLQGMNFGTSTAYCGFGSSTTLEGWSTMPGTVLASGALSCMVPARGAGMRVVEVALTKNGEMSRSGVQVEYAAIGSVTAVQPSTGSIDGGTVVTVSGSGFMAGVTSCKFGSIGAVQAAVASSTEARCVAPAGVRGAVPVEVSIGGEGGVAATSASDANFIFESTTFMRAVSPAFVGNEGGSVMSVAFSGATDGSQGWCKFGNTGVVVASGVVRDGVAPCVSTAGVMGNMTVDVSVNGQDFTSDGFTVQTIAVANVTSIRTGEMTPARVPVTGGSAIVMTGVGFRSAIFCGFGAATRAETWAAMPGSLLASGKVNCMVPNRDAGFRVVEAALTKNGEMSRSGLQVEYATIGSVTALQPSTGSMAGGTVVTVTGSGFVAGVTACKFGSGSTLMATVVSSTEARCATPPAGSAGVVSVKVAMGLESDAALVSASSQAFELVEDKPVTVVSPLVAIMNGGSELAVTVPGHLAGTPAWCKIGRVVVAAKSTSEDLVKCVGVAGILGNTTVEVSTNNQDFTTDGKIVENIVLSNVTMLMPRVVPVTGGSTVIVRGSGLPASGGFGYPEWHRHHSVFCRFGASAVSEAWSVTSGMLMSSRSLSCTVPARNAGFRVVELALSKNGDTSRSGVQVEYAAIGSVTAVTPSTGLVNGGTVVTLAGAGFIAGRTACKFGSASALMASVVSSTEARCVAPAGSRGAVAVEVSMGVSTNGALVSSNDKLFMYGSDPTVLEVSPTVALTDGGSVLSVVASGVYDGSRAFCKFGGSVVVVSESVNGGIVECVAPASQLGNMTWRCRPMAKTSLQLV
jgi:hypothetical protein